MDDRKLISGIKKKKESYLIEFIDIYGPVLKASIIKTIGNRKELVNEILNDSILAIWDNIDSFDESKSSFKNWCAGVAKYKAIDAIRKENRHKSVDLEDIEEAIGTYKDYSFDDSEIFRKLYIEGYSYDDIAKIKQIPKDRLYNRVSRSKKKLKAQLGGRHD